jgi:hypothetical protein
MVSDVETMVIDHHTNILHVEPMNVESGADMLRALVITYIMAKTPAFYQQVCDEVQMETAKSCKDIIRGKTTSKLVSERVMSKIFSQIPEEVYDIATTCEDTIEEKALVTDFVVFAIQQTVEHDVDMSIAKLAQEFM